MIYNMYTYIYIYVVYIYMYASYIYDTICSLGLAGITSHLVICKVMNSGCNNKRWKVWLLMMCDNTYPDKGACGRYQQKRKACSMMCDDIEPTKRQLWSLTNKDDTSMMFKICWWYSTRRRQRPSGESTKTIKVWLFTTFDNIDPGKGACGKTHENNKV